MCCKHVAAGFYVENWNKKMIASKTNQKLKKVRKLISSAKERRETGLFVAEGVRICSEATAELLDMVLVSEDCDIDISGYKNAEVVEKNIFRELSDTVNPQGVLAVLRQPGWIVNIEKKDGSICSLSRSVSDVNHETCGKENEVLLNGQGRVLLLDGIRDPGNMGTIVRTAEAAGVKAVFMSPDCVDLYNPKVTRSTMGSIFRVPCVSCELVPVIEQLKAAGINIYGTSLQTDKSFRDVDFSNAGIVIGSEAYGVSPAVAAAVTDNVKIPMAGAVESLNAAVSAAIMMFC